MKKAVWNLLVLGTLLFTGCSQNSHPQKNITEQNLDLKRNEVTTEKSEKNQEKSTELNKKSVRKLSEKEYNNLRIFIEKYYDSINKKLIDCVQMEDESSFMQDYDGYTKDEVVMFRITVENSENKRYIIIGSKDDWKNCEVLNEGY